MPDNTLHLRAKESALRIMRSGERKEPLPSEMAALVAEVVTKWWIETEAVSINNTRLSIMGSAREKATQVARSVAWMHNPDRHKGQQARECAKKTLRALRRRSIQAEQLFAHCDEFGSLRKSHIARANSKRPRRAAREIPLPHFGIVASWLTSADDISRVGHQMSNCLANPECAKEYTRRLRDGSAELIVLTNNDDDSVALICADPTDESIEAVKGPHNERPIEHRWAIIATLAQCQFQVGENSDFLGLAICNELLKADRNDTIVRFSAGGRECEVGDGFVAAVMDDETILLRSHGCQSGYSEVCVVESNTDNTDTDYAKQMKARNWFRRTCWESKRFARACDRAFPGDALADFRDDWFTTTLEAATR